MVRSIYVARHGYRANWVKGVVEPNPPTQIDGDTVLAPHGLSQAKELAAALTKLEPRVGKIYASPFYRCIQTAEVAADALDLEIYAEPGFGEYYPRERVTHPTPAGAKQLHELIKRVTADYEPLNSVDLEGETRQELYARVGETLTRMMMREKETEAVIIFTHAATAVALGHVLTGNTDAEVRTGACSLSHYSAAAHGTALGEWTTTKNGDTSFLAKGEEMHWSFDSPYEAGSTEDIASRDHNPQAGPATVDADGEEMVSVYVPLDMGIANMMSGIAGRRVLSQHSFQVAGLHENQPLVKIGEDIYQGDWQDITGTELYVTGEGKYLGKSRSRLVLQPMQIKSRAEQAEESRAPKRTLAQRIQEINQKRAQEAADGMDVDTANEHAGNGLESTENDIETKAEAA